MLPTRFALFAGLLATIAALLVAVPAPAAAAEQSFTDPSGDTTHPADIVSVTVKHGDRIVVVVHHRNLTFSDPPAELRIVYDTSKKHAGPEFYLRVAYQTDRPSELRTAHGWGTFHSPPIATCAGERVRVRPGKDRTRISVPSSCFGDPKRVRVQARMTPYAGDARSADSAPGPRRLGPWVTK